MDVIDQFYENINIYNSLVVYHPSSSHTINRFINAMTEKDYPVCHYDKHLDIDFQESNHRMLVIESSCFEEYLCLKERNLSNISIIICIDNESYRHVKNNMNDITCEQDIIVFTT